MKLAHIRVSVDRTLLCSQFSYLLILIIFRCNSSDAPFRHLSHRYKNPWLALHYPTGTQTDKYYCRQLRCQTSVFQIFWGLSHTTLTTAHMSLGSTSLVSVFIQGQYNRAQRLHIPVVRLWTQQLKRIYLRILNILVHQVSSLQKLVLGTVHLKTKYQVWNRTRFLDLRPSSGSVFHPNQKPKFFWISSEVI